MKNNVNSTVLFFFVLCLFSCNKKEEDKGIATIIANANGAKAFAAVKSIDFTFNVDKDTVQVVRRWKWMPGKNEVIFYDKNDSTQFKRMDTSTALLKKLNAQFTNDEYWLVFPLHLQWDNGYTLTNNDTAIAPVTGKQLHKYTVQYNSKDGFTPGDMYEIYTDEKYMIQEWAYHKTASKEPSLMASWESYGDFGGIKIAKEHKSKDGTFRLFFTGITVVK